MSDHFPERMCVVCRSKNNKSDLFRIAEKNGKYVFDSEQTEQSRGLYICKTAECLQRLSKHKKIKVENEELLKMANLLKKQQKDYLNILKAMKNSQALTFGMNMVLEQIQHIHFIIIAQDISEKNDRKITEKAKEHNIPFVYYGTKTQLGDIFSKDEVTVIAVTDKKIARGLVN